MERISDLTLVVETYQRMWYIAPPMETGAFCWRIAGVSLPRLIYHGSVWSHLVGLEPPPRRRHLNRRFFEGGIDKMNMKKRIRLGSDA
jgi:hypothetical protein